MNHLIPTTDEALELFPFLQSAKPKLLQFTTGTPIFTEGESCGRIGFIVSGSVRVYKMSETGREITLYRILRGESCILSMSCALSHPIHHASAVVEHDAEVLVVNIGDFRELVRQSHEARDYVFTQFSERMTNLMLLIEEVIFRRMDERIAALLYRKTDTENPTLEYTHEELATDLGTVREVVSRVLKEFEREKMIVLSRGSITVVKRKDLKKIARLLSE